MARSIMQDKRGGECYLCNILLGIDTPAPCREEHHVMHGTANRRLAEHYGLKVYLCPVHHRTGPEAVHTDPRMDMMLKQAAQRAFERKYSHGKWMEVFGKNYLDQTVAGASRQAAGREPEEDLPESSRQAAGREPAATWKNQQNKPFNSIHISQNIPAGFLFLSTDRNPGKEGS